MKSRRNLSAPFQSIDGVIPGKLVESSRFDCLDGTKMSFPPLEALTDIQFEKVLMSIAFVLSISRIVDSIVGQLMKAIG